MKKLNLELDILELDSKELVRQSIEEAFGNDNAKNVGSVENHCDGDIKEYYIGLAKGDKQAKEKQNKMLKEFLNDDRF
ncbi:MULTISPECIES: hypothetical protein [Helicobacter]|uniref:Uncharacterized protein n=1 Tax=Helicobacter trogontum TaxID=50960 RepID=A0A4U8SZE5_9HELI|nr:MULTISPECIES: hypothetical protein [Helicobacter]MDY5184434.1 hypothetical protein [Helicobacter trogontum]TLD92401.1 hypothetical protein LS80_010975 [Helicobacter trogontum]